MVNVQERRFSAVPQNPSALMRTDDVGAPATPPASTPQQILVFTSPGDVRALQGQVKADLESIRSSLQRCALAGTFSPTTTPGEWDAWQSMKTRASDYIAETPALLSTVSQYQRGELVQAELAGWHDRARALGCDAGPAPTLPAQGTPFFAGLGLGSSGTVLLLLLALYLMKGSGHGRR